MLTGQPDSAQFTLQLGGLVPLNQGFTGRADTTGFRYVSVRLVVVGPYFQEYIDIYVHMQPSEKTFVASLFKRSEIQLYVVPCVR